MRRGASALVGVVLALAARGQESRAEDAGSASDRSIVIARVGPSRAITVGELEDRLAAVPGFQRLTFGTGVDGVRRGFLEQVLVRDALLALGGEAQGLDSKPGTAFALDRARSEGTLRAIRARIGPASAITRADVQRYYDANLARYDTPERYQIWRILCKTRDEAQAVLGEAKKEPTPRKFEELARNHSLDKSTNLRAGNLGFVTADGTSSEPGWKVDEAVVRAATAVRDGELVPTPVAEGEHFSVVWRRGTIPATRRSVDDAAAQISDTLWKARVKEATDELLASLRASKMRDLDEAALDSLRFAPEQPLAGVRRADAAK